MTPLETRPRLRLRTTTGLLITATLLILTGCTALFDKDDPSSPGNSPTKSAEPKLPPLPKPTMPGIAEKKTTQGSVAFAKYYYSLAAYGHETGSWKQLKELSSPNCSQCVDLWTSEGTRFGTNDIVLVRGGGPDSMGIQGSRTSPQVFVYAGPRSQIDDRHVEYLPDNFRGWGDTLDLVYTEHGWRVEQIDILQIES